MKLDSTILITGGGGVLGDGLKKALSLRGYTNIYSPNRDEMNALDIDSTNSYFKNIKPDYVFHLASLVYGLKGNLDNQFKSLTTNTLINQNVLQACKDAQVKKVFFAGTVASYSYPFVKLPLSEEDFLTGDPHDGEYGYAMAKRHALSYLKIMKKYHNIDFCYGLFTNLFGTNDKFDKVNGHVIPSLIEKAYNAISDGSKVLNVWGNPNTSRDFLFNLDAGIFAIDAMTHYSGVINIASGVETKMKDVVDGINKFFNNELNIQWDPNAPIGIPKRSVDITLLNEFKSKFDFNLEKSISETISWYKNNLNGIRK